MYSNVGILGVIMEDRVRLNIMSLIIWTVIIPSQRYSYRDNRGTMGQYRLSLPPRKTHAPKQSYISKNNLYV